ncbi:MAG: hypothetical protein BGO43_04950 [Gammaproteobacteria bacterium 39-13]|nr:RES family NAD+ phosphorylase [Gammaproteobacteria bacterium]OJV96200.1 MAG: hypothetical protein BGO43_04950 [Gammaproteobacteria bacterium 39-13]
MGQWHQLKGKKYFSEAKMSAWRIVEDQSKSTTRKFVDTAKEHDLLEQLIEQSKPKIKYCGDEKYFKDLHYLLSTPFRYPPLKWGSRFGTRYERGIFYCSLNINTAMSEKAFYLMTFLHASEGNLGGKTTPYTAFKIHIESMKFVNFLVRPFSDFEEEISSKISYQFSQMLGREMREDDVQCFQYRSARCHEKGINVGIYTPEVLTKNENLEESFQHLNCYITKDVIEFSPKPNYKASTYVFPLEMFLVEGKIPLPPN